MQSLKSLVIGMGALITIGLGLLVYGVYHQASDPNVDLIAKTPQTPEINRQRYKYRKPPQVFGDMSISLPEGCHITSITPARGQRVFLLIGPSGPPCERIIAINANNGTLLGSINIKTKP